MTGLALGVPRVPAAACVRLRGGSVKGCACRLEGGGWAECPPEARGVLVVEGTVVAAAAVAEIAAAVTVTAAPALSGDACAHCGAFALVRTGTCTTCQACGESGGCG